MDEGVVLQLLLGRVGELPALLVLPLSGHLLASGHQSVQVDVAGSVNVELGRLPIL